MSTTDNPEPEPVPDLSDTTTDDLDPAGPNTADPTLGPDDDPDADPEAPEEQRVEDVVITDDDPGPMHGNSDPSQA